MFVIGRLDRQGAIMNPHNPQQRRQNSRNWAMFLALAGFAGLVYAITIVKILEYGR